MDIKRLVEQCTRNPNTLTTYNLLSRIRESSLDEARLMLEKHPKLRDSKDESGKTLLHFAAKCGDEIMTQYFIRGGCQVNVADQHGNTPLILAAKSRNLSVVYKLLEANATNVLAANDVGESAAEIIVRDLKCNFVMVMTLLMKRVKEECGNDSLTTARKLLEIRCCLSQAVCSRDTIITEYMLKNGCSANERSDDEAGLTPLHQAIRTMDLDNIELLIDYGADVDAERCSMNERSDDSEGLTPLHQAVRSTDLDNVELLLDYGADVDAEMKKPRERPVHQVRWGEKGSEDVFKALLRRRCDLTDDDGKLSVGQHLQRDDEETVGLLLQCLPDLNAKDHSGCPLLRYLAGNEQFDPVEELEGRTLDVNGVSEEDGWTALMAAVYQNNVRTVEWLLKNGAQVDTINDHRERALDFAFDNSENFKMKPRLEPRLKCIELLLKYGTDVQWADEYGDNIFRTAVGSEEFQLSKPILAHLAVTEALGVEVRDLVSAKIQSHVFLRSYFALCKRAIESMKRAKVRGSMTLFDFLTASERDVTRWGRNEKVLSRLKVLIFVRKRRSKLYYDKVLWRRLTKVVEMASLRNKALRFVLRIEGLCGNGDVAEKIVDYFTCDDLMIVALV